MTKSIWDSRVAGPGKLLILGGPGTVGDGKPSDNGPQAVLVGLLQNLGTAGVSFPKTVVAASLFPNVGDAGSTMV